jgi:hypothetical protein
MSSTVTAMTGILGWGLQYSDGGGASIKCGDAAGVSTNWDKYKPGGTDNASEVWYRHKALSVDFGIVDDTRVSDMEVGGDAYPTGAYKASEFVAGGGVLQPRLEDAFNLLLYALTGYASDIGAYDVEGNAVSDVATHQFRFRRDSALNSVSLPWLGVRKYIPGAASGEDMEEIGVDCRLTALRIAVPQSGVMVATPAFTGRKGFMSDQSFADWNAFDAFDSIPISTKGHFKLAAEGTTAPFGNGTEYPALGVTLDFTNGLTTPAQEMIIGDYHPDDFAVLQRALTIRWTYKWQDDVLYRAIKANAGTGASIDWSPIVYNTAFEMLLESADSVPTTSQAYQFYTHAPSVHWTTDGSPRLVGGGMLAVDMVGTALQYGTTTDYAEIRVCHDDVTYQWES